MKDIAKMRLSVIREIKNIQKFFDYMEKSVRSRDYQKVYTAYTFLTSLVYHMNDGDLTPDSIELKKHAVQEYFRKKED
jgi:hypothetical protein